MKKIVIVLVNIIFVILIILGIIYLIDLDRMKNNEQVLFSTWGSKYNNPEEYNYIIENTINNTSTSITEEDRDKFIEIINNYAWKNDITNCDSDYKFIINNKIYLFHSECGSINKDKQSIILSNEDKEKIINICKKYYSGIENDKPCFYGKVIESNEKYIIVEPIENEEERKSSDKFYISLGENNDAIYQIGTNVKVTYTGFIQETYPAKIDVIDIELKSCDKFDIEFNKNEKLNIEKIVDKSETDKYNYSIYSYKGTVDIIINEEKMTLKEALLNNKIAMEEIIQKANEDANNKIIESDMYNDGGSMIYKYENYTIIKVHNLNGNRDVYIGSKDMSLNSVL